MTISQKGIRYIVFFPVCSWSGFQWEFRNKSLQLTRLSWEDTHETRKKGVDSTQHFGIAAGHARSDAPLERLEVSQDSWGLQHCQQEAENLQSCADVGDVRLGWLLLRGQKGVDTISGRSMKHIFFVLLLKQIEIHLDFSIKASYLKKKKILICIFLAKRPMLKQSNIDNSAISSADRWNNRFFYSTQLRNQYCSQTHTKTRHCDGC